MINKAGISDENELDFALAFVDTKKEQISVESEITQVIKPDEKLRYDSISSQTFTVPSDMARIALFQNIKKIIIYSLGTIVLSISEKDKKVSCRGRISVTSIRERSDRSYALIEIQSRKRYYISLPCTLLAISNRNYFELGENSYRGSIIVAPEKNGFFSVINLCHVEEYLQGVVPLEIGKRSEKDIEAIKAQAIAARTYTYKRILERQKQPYDLLPTVADQVYGGANVEYPLSNRAIKATKGMVLIYGDSLIYAYYHSTCGGITANVEDVWEKQPAPYLRSRKDVDQDGKPYCSISKFFTWKESWRTSDLSSIIRNYSRSAYPEKSPFKGNVRQISIIRNFGCGRVALCRIVSTNGTYTYGGDKIRFLLRRNLAKYPILRSSKFRVVQANSKQVTLEGKGYGHGVGLCQMGAIGRAREGQSFEQILLAYYTGVRIVTVKSGEE